MPANRSHRHPPPAAYLAHLVATDPERDHTGQARPTGIRHASLRHPPTPLYLAHLVTEPDPRDHSRQANGDAGTRGCGDETRASLYAPGTTSSSGSVTGSRQVKSRQS